MNKEIMTSILNKIKEYDKIIISRHVRPDGDCVGSTIGLKEIIKNTFPNKDVRLINTDYAEYLQFLGKEDESVSEEYYKDTLVIVLDNATSDRCSNPLFNKGKEIIKIDHHIEKEAYGDIRWVEEHKSSVCEMITEFYVLFKEELKISKEGVIALYTGIVTDSGRFKFDSINGDTLRTTSHLLDEGINIEDIYSHLYLKSKKEVELQKALYKKVKFTSSGVAYICVPLSIQKKYGLLSEEASAQISLVEGIKGSIIWVAFIDLPDGKIRVRIRSRYVEINKVAEKYRGGGHARASGATLYNKKEIKLILNDLDAISKEYKEQNPECL